MRLVIAISAVATLLTACSFFDAEGPVRTTQAPPQIEQATPATEDTSHISDVPSPTPRLDPDSQPGQPPLNSTPKGPPQLTEADQTLAEKRRWCKAWALDNLEPIVYDEFLNLDPLNMDDIDRTIWRNRLGAGICWMYGSEPLDVTNANRRNEQYKAECLKALVGAADSHWGQLDIRADRFESLAYEIPNQYARILRWVHLSGAELLAMEDPPHELLRSLRSLPHTKSTSIPDHNELATTLHELANLRSSLAETNPDLAKTIDHSEESTLEWWGIVAASEGSTYTDYAKKCRGYYPQLFTGSWTPEAQPYPQAPEIPPELADKIKRILKGPLYLPRP